MFESAWTNLINLMLKKQTKEQETIHNKQQLRQQINGSKPEISINTHFMNSGLRSEKWSLNGRNDCNGNCEEYNMQSVPGSIYVEVADSGHVNGCFNGCHCVKNTQL